MIILNEFTGEVHDTVEECLEAEKEFKRQKEEEEKAKKTREEELDKAYKEAVEACEKYFKLSGIDIDRDDNHLTFSIKQDDEDDDLFEKIYRLMF